MNQTELISHIKSHFEYNNTVYTLDAELRKTPTHKYIVIATMQQSNQVERSETRYAVECDGTESELYSHIDRLLADVFPDESDYTIQTGLKRTDQSITDASVNIKIQSA